jgi:hypothetical protein
MKKLVILPLLILTFSCFSQDTVKLPTHVAKQIIKDLVDYESVKAQLKLIKEQMDVMDQVSQAKDTIILNYKYKVENCESRIEIEKRIVDLYKQEAIRLKKEYKKLKLKTTLTKIGSGAIIGTLTYLLIVK